MIFPIDTVTVSSGAIVQYFSGFMLWTTLKNGLSSTLAPSLDTDISLVPHDGRTGEEMFAASY